LRYIHDVTGVILAGGLGKRLRPVVSDLPKPMAIVDGRPFLEYLIMQFSYWGIKEVVISVGYRAEQIKSYFGDGDRWGIKIRYSQESSPLGTGGGLKRASQMVETPLILATNGDSIVEIDFQQLLNRHHSCDCVLTMVLVEVEDTARYGRVLLDEHNHVVGFNEKGIPGVGLINAGMYLFESSLINSFLKDIFSFEKDFLPECLHKIINGYVSKGYFIDIGTPEDYLRVRDSGELFRLIAGNKSCSQRAC